LSSVGHGAIAPLVALSALDLGASVQLSAMVAGLAAIGQLLGDLPASWVATRLGDKRAIVVACLWDAAFLTVACLSRSLPLLAVAVLCFGPAGAVFGLARQSYITESAPAAVRARALSTLGGAFRFGAFLGPLAGAAIIDRWSLSAAYGFAAGMSLLAAGLTLTLPDLPGERVRPGQRPDEAKLWPVLRHYHKVYLRLGTGVMILSLARSCRQVILPLWCAAQGFTAQSTSLVYAVSMAIDTSLFFLGGLIMDRHGRRWVAVPSMIVLGLGLAGLSLAHHPAAVVVMAAVLGLGNGVGAGLVMVLGSDASPAVGRPQFLSGWRLMSDVGNTLAPVAISALVALTASLGLAAVGLGAVVGLGAAWLGSGIPRRSPPPPGGGSA
jgi:MFS family permease